MHAAIFQLAGGTRIARPLLVLALVAWFIGFALLLPDAGPWTDDYGFTLRGFQTESIWPTSSPWDSLWPYYWRPVFLAVAYYGATLLWDHWWVLALVTAACHALVAHRVWRLSRTIGLNELASGAAALVTLTYPLAFESAFWWAGIGTPGAVAVGVYVVERAWRFASPQRVRLIGLLWVFVWASLLVNINEQPVSLFAGACAAALVSGWLARRTGHEAASARQVEARERPVRAALHALGRSAWVALACGGACAVYVALLVATSPAGKRGASGGYVTLEQLPTRIHAIARQAYEKLLGQTAQEFFAGSFIHGLRTLVDQGVLLGGGCALALLVSAAWLVRSAMRVSARDAAMSAAPGRAFDMTRERERASRFAAAFISALVLACAFVPNVLVVSNTLCSRYFLVIGVVLGLWAAIVVQALTGAESVMGTGAGTGGEPSRAGEHRSPLRHAVAGLLVAAITIAGTLSMLGFQRVFRERFLQEAAQVRALRDALEDAPAGTFYICLQDDSRTASTGFQAFDRCPSHSIRFPWSARSYIRRGVDRADAEALPMIRPGVRASLARWPIDGVTVIAAAGAGGTTSAASPTDRANAARDGLVVTRPAGRPARVIPLDRCVPYVLREDGSIALVSRLTAPVVAPVVAQPGSTPTTSTPPSTTRIVEFPLVSAIRESQRPTIEFSMVDAEAPADSAPTTLSP